MGCLSLLASRLRITKTKPRVNAVESEMRDKMVQATATALEYEPSPPAYTQDAASTFARNEKERDALVKTIEHEIDAHDEALRELSLKMFDHPEISFEERYAHDQLTAFMRDRGFKVEEHAFGLETAWQATFQHGSGGRTLGVNSEMDALPGIGHACGHPLIAIIGVGIALAVKKALEEHDIPGKIVLLGTPAEEGGGGKILMINAGAYKGMDACLMAHPGPGPSKSAGTGASLAIRSLDIEFFGHTAHAGAAPWEGQNALDAAVLAYNAVSVLRQEIKPDHRVHGIILGRDWAPNIIPDYAKMKWIVRAPTYAQADTLYARVMNCFKAAALATSCRIEIKDNENLYDLVQNEALASEFADVSSAFYDVAVGDAPGAIGGSTDFGNVTYVVPALHPSFAIPTLPSGGNHTVLFTEAARKPEAHAAALVVAKALAVVGLRVVRDEKFAKACKDAFERQIPPRSQEIERVQKELAEQAKQQAALFQ